MSIVLRTVYGILLALVIGVASAADDNLETTDNTNQATETEQAPRPCTMAINLQNASRRFDVRVSRLQGNQLTGLRVLETIPQDASTTINVTPPARIDLSVRTPPGTPYGNYSKIFLRLSSKPDFVYDPNNPKPQTCLVLSTAGSPSNVLTAMFRPKKKDPYSGTLLLYDTGQPYRRDNSAWGTTIR
ncbi:MAG: hypothetical protein CMF50_08975 [Legionellales bacterium]|nr:hypothetical protein [Legionellales bacterium]|tara:strand:+ start:14828 stop:15388 length:561 start_codon:yes stop_codon:yes gene_type:complete